MSAQVAERRKVAITRFTGFDDIDDDVEPTEENGMLANTNKKKRGGRKRNRRQKTDAQENEKLHTENTNAPKSSLFKTSRLLQEIHDRERVHGMKRDEARQLLEDKLLFLEDTSLRNVHLRRFCLVVPSDELFELEDGTQIPAEIVSISMDNGKINSILRFFPSHTNGFELKSVETYENYRMRRVYWHPAAAKDSNLMYRTWSHFLERCLLSLLLVPLNKLAPLLDFLRKINEIRTVLNNRLTVSICLSRVICVEDYLTAIQNVMNTQIELDFPPPLDHNSLSYALSYCHYHLHCMDKIFSTMGAFHSNSFTPSVPQFCDHRRIDFTSWSCHQEAHINMEPEKYQRILHWLSNLSLDPVENVEETYDNTISYDEEDEFFTAGTP